MKFETSKITERGQITIPENFRKKYGGMRGDKVLFMKENKGLFLRPARKIDFKELNRILEKTKKIKPRYNLSAGEMDKINEGLFR